MNTLFANELHNHPESPRNNYLAGWFTLQQIGEAANATKKQQLFERSEYYFERALALEPSMGQAAVGLVCLNASIAPEEKTNQSLHRLHDSLAGFPPTRGSIASLEWFTDCAGTHPEGINANQYMAIMETAVKSSGRSTIRRTDVLVQIARYLGIYKKDIAGAIAYSERASQIRPNDSQLLLGLARWQLVAKQLHEAQTSLDRAAQVSPSPQQEKEMRHLKEILQQLQRNPAAQIELN